MNKYIRTQLTLIGLILCHTTVSAQHFANGLKVGEVTSSTAVLWTRLTENPGPLRDDYTWNVIPKKGEKLTSPLPGETPGVVGEVEVSYKHADQEEWTTQPWVSVTGETDYTHRTQFTELEAGSRYELRIRSRKNQTAVEFNTLKGSFVTAPRSDQSENISFNIITCQGYHRRDQKDGHKIYQNMLSTDPQFFVNTGDAVYFDKPLPYAKDIPTARYKWNRFYSMPHVVALHNKLSCYFMKDDHDVLSDDAFPGMTYGDLTFKDGQRLFKEQTTFPDVTPYRTVRWGKDCQIWLMETRDFRTPNDHKIAKERTIWGEEQMKWLESSLEQSDATFKFVISATPIVGPDRARGKKDNHANKQYQLEGDRVRRLIASHSNTFVLNGDRHWQYASIDEETGLHEFCSGPASDIHASGYSLEKRTTEHMYLKICGGFLNVKVSSNTSEPTKATITHYSVDGEVNHTQTFVATR